MRTRSGGRVVGIGTKIAWIEKDETYEDKRPKRIWFEHDEQVAKDYASLCGPVIVYYIDTKHLT